MSKKYVIEFTKEQLRTMARGLEFYSRFLAGQWEIPDAMEFKEYKNQGKVDGFWEMSNQVEEQLKFLKVQFTGLPLNASYGIGSDRLHKDAKVSYDIYRPIWEQFAKEYREKNPGKKHYSVYDSPGLQYSDEGRIKVEVKEE
jgi:hypothetical protein